MKRAFLLGLLVLPLASCITRQVKEPIFEQDRTSVFLRSERKLGSTLPKGYGHPLQLSAARMAHILSRIDLRTGEGDANRRAAIPLDQLYVIADGMAQAFSKAGPDQEVVVMAVERSKHWGLFDRNYLTSLLAFVRDDLLYVQVARAGWEIPSNLETKLPEPILGEEVMPFRLVPSESMALVGTQTVAVTWRDPIFQRASRTRILPSGKVVRREILMETPEEAPTPPLATDVLPANLSADTLRKLADLEDSKKRGEVTQAEYTAMRESILRADPSHTE
jgi:hypothetical protein